MWFFVGLIQSVLRNEHLAKMTERNKNKQQQKQEPEQRTRMDNYQNESNLQLTLITHTNTEIRKQGFSFVATLIRNFRMVIR